MYIDEMVLSVNAGVWFQIMAGGGGLNFIPDPSLLAVPPSPVSVWLPD